MCRVAQSPRLRGTNAQCIKRGVESAGAVGSGKTVLGSHHLSKLLLELFDIVPIHPKPSLSSQDLDPSRLITVLNHRPGGKLVCTDRFAPPMAGFPGEPKPSEETTSRAAR